MVSDSSGRQISPPCVKKQGAVKMKFVTPFQVTRSVGRRNLPYFVGLCDCKVDYRRDGDACIPVSSTSSIVVK